VLRRQHHPGQRRPRRRLDPTAAPPARPGHRSPGRHHLPGPRGVQPGVSGDTSESLLARLEAEARPRLLGDQAVIVIAIGINETAVDGTSGTPVASERRFAEHLALLVAAARRHTDQVLLVGLLPCDETRMQPAPWSSDGESYGNDRIALFNDAVRRVAAEHGVALVDCYEEVLAGDHAALLHDGLHPNGAGHQLLADRIGEAIGPWL
jgi:lysophospholipase L1-like esterase